MPTKPNPNDIIPDQDDIVVDEQPFLTSSNPMGQELRQDYPWVRQYVRPVLEGGGMLAGGTIGGPAGAGLGYSAGRQGANLLEESLGMKPPVGVVNRLTGALQDAVLGKYMDVAGNKVGGILGGTIQKLASPGYGKANLPGAQYRAWLGEKYGVPLSPADITESKGQALLESGLEKSMFGGDTLQDFRRRQLGKWNQLRGDYIPSELPSRGGAGESIQGGMTKASQDAYGVAQSKYAKVPKDTPVSLNSVGTMAQELLSEEQLLKPSFQAGGEVMAQLEELATRPATTFQGAQKLRSRLLELERKLDPLAVVGYKGAGHGSVGPFKRIRAALDQDIESSLGSAAPDAARAYRDANQYYRETVKGLYGGPTAKKVMNKDPEFVTAWATSMGEGKTPPITRIRTLKQALPEEQFNMIRDQFTANQLFGLNAKDQVPVNQLKSVMAQYGDEFLGELYAPEQLAELREIADLGSSLLTAEKIAGNPSGTAQVSGVLNFLQNMVRHPITTTLSSVGQKPLAESYLQGFLRRRLLSGEEVPLANTLRGVGSAATKMGEVGAVELADDKPVGKTKDGKPVYRTKDGRYWSD